MPYELAAGDPFSGLIANANFNGANLFTLQATSINAADLNALNGKTTIAINASLVTSTTGAAAEIKTLYNSRVAGKFIGLSN